MRPNPLLLLLTLALSAACEKGTGPEGTGPVTLYLTLPAAAAAAPVVGAGGDVLAISAVQVVARRIKLERRQGSCPSEDAEDGSGSQESSECPALWLEPRLLEPPLDEAARALVSVDLPEGSYRALQLQVHKPTGSSGDAALLAQHPEFEGVSVRVAGSFNGTDFVFNTALTAVVKVALETPVEVVAGVPAVVTLEVDVPAWFRNGGNLLNPIQPSQQIRSRIEQNIRQSFRAFRDASHHSGSD